MAIEIQTTASNQTVTGQPVAKEASNVEVVETPGLDPATAVATAEGAEGAETAETAQATTPVNVSISPEALKQITSLSTSNRELKLKLKELEAKQAASVTSEDVTAKLAQLAALENESPRAYLKRTGKTLEDIAADVLTEDKEIADPRVDALQAKLDEIAKRTEELAAGKQTDAAAQQATNYKARVESAKQHVDSVIAAQPDRWTLVAADKEIASAVVEAAMLVVKRDHTDEKGNLKPFSKEQAEAILFDCLDEAETYALAKEMVGKRKNLPPTSDIVVKSKGLDVVESASYASRKGDDGKQVGNARTPKVTIDGNRGAIPRGPVKRGPTDVRTARLRALKIAGADIADE